MKTYIASLVLTALIGSPAYAQGLSGAILPCKKDEVLIQTIGADIATAVVRTLVGTAIDTAVAYLDDPKVSNYEVIVPVDDADSLTDGTKCIFISSERITPDGRIKGNSLYESSSLANVDLFIKFQISKSSTPSASGTHPLRAGILAWQYKNFLSDNCPFLRQCSKRDIVMKLGFMLPTSSANNTTHTSEPFGFTILNATAQEVQKAVQLEKGGVVTLPWTTSSELKGPINVRFELIETSQPNAFTKALAAAVKAQKGAIQDTVENKIKGLSDQVAATAAQPRVTEAAKAFDNYKTAYDVALATKAAYHIADANQQKILAVQYEIQRRSVKLAETLGKAAFKLADLDWPSGGLGDLPAL
ncbi:hypothetical protein [Pseudomonas sp. RGM2987]|uniref:hypothetical protein n=1 Tax=Pseudomonas sp. RGM2987 TaxID=2930090 RepID=UPI001FD6D31A|nr:hypothetical protein [Pseudomonas sp. RGM2987]MCJ8205128.1 hypothetical protein [Pseudomonas sp. RGM2987]